MNDPNNISSIDKELEDAKSNYLGKRAYSHETNAQQAHYLGYYEIIGLGADFDNPTKEDLAKVMNKLVDYAVNFRNPEIVKKHYDEPEMRVTFSPDGYNKVRACHDAIFGFLRPLCETDVETVNGYPFSIERDQKEDFIVHIKQVD